MFHHGVRQHTYENPPKKKNSKRILKVTTASDLFQRLQYKIIWGNFKDSSKKSFGAILSLL